MNLKAYTQQAAKIARLEARVESLEEQLRALRGLLEREYQRKRGPRAEAEKEVGAAAY